MKNTLIVHEIASCHGSGEMSKVELVAHTDTGEVELIISKTIRERYALTDYEKVMRLHENLNRGGGRMRWSLEDLTK